MAIPLVNPQLELLPVHFATDPGPNCDWRSSDECVDFDLPPERRIRLIEQYMDVKFATLPASENTAKRVEAFDRLMHHRGGSLDSAQINSLVGNGRAEEVGRAEEGKKQGPAGVSRQIHGAVVRTFGSLGKSVSQKLRNIASGAKTNKRSVGTVTQSSRTSTLAVQMLSNQRQVIRELFYLPIHLLLVRFNHRHIY